eukprot:6195639-Pleurochrysis_carterae.AAC.2
MAISLSARNLRAGLAHKVHHGFLPHDYKSPKLCVAHITASGTLTWLKGDALQQRLAGAWARRQRKGRASASARSAS